AAWQAEAFDQVRIADANIQLETEASPSALLAREFYGLVHDGDARWRAPTLADINAATLEQAISSVAATFGALPHRSQAHAASDGDEHFPAPTREPVQLTHRGAANQAVAAIAWPTKGFFSDLQEPRTLRVLAEILSQRLLDELRTREGITYTPGASTYTSLVTPAYGFVYALAQIPPDKIATFYNVVASVVEDLKNKPVGADELERARGPRIEDILRQQQT